MCPTFLSAVKTTFVLELVPSITLSLLAYVSSCGYLKRPALNFLRAVFKYQDTKIVYTASGSDYEEFKSHFSGEYLALICDLNANNLRLYYWSSVYTVPIRNFMTAWRHELLILPQRRRKL